MRATKEDAEVALANMKELYNSLPRGVFEAKAGCIQIVQSFIERAHKALPTQAAVNKDRKRKRAAKV